MMFSILLSSICAVAAALLGAQVQISEVNLLTGRYNYRMQAPQVVSLVSCMAVLAIAVIDVLWLTSAYLFFRHLLVGVVLWMFSEWLLAKWSPRRLLWSAVWRLCFIVGTVFLVSGSNGHVYLLPFVAMGLWLRNSPLGVVHGKPYFLASHMHRQPVTRWPGTPSQAPIGLADDQRRYNVADYGILPNTGQDVLPGVQALIDQVGREGGGSIFFPRGRYLFNLGGKGEFLQINFSHITLEGERNAQGKLLTELVNGGPTIRGDRNPWLSPFFITTGEALQPSNIFWGLNFRKPEAVRMASSSLSDPGSDGTILTPPFATVVTNDAPAGATMLRVEDSTKVGKYILLGMYNTTPDGSLLKELLGVETLRDEWLTAHRAGDEEAPSFQWLAEVRRIIDSHTIELSRPLLKDCLTKWQPAIFNVDMLEDIHIRHLRINSSWNGLFHHHGLPLYYSVAQAQTMDYGWNGINMKRTAHSSVENIEICNFTNPLYVQDSRDVRVEWVDVSGYDGHQGLKAYCHTCDCTFRHITFRSHFADMMGGEGNAYANTFSKIRYLNPMFNPVDYDFHGFAEGPFAPPAYNTFNQVEGFRYIKGAGAPFMQPACAGGNLWKQCVGEGERRGTQLFFAMSYREKKGLTKFVTATGYTVAVMLKKRQWSPQFAIQVFKGKLASIDRMGIPRQAHAQFFPQTRIEDMQTTAVFLRS